MAEANGKARRSGLSGTARLGSSDLRSSCGWQRKATDGLRQEAGWKRGRARERAHGGGIVFAAGLRLGWCVSKRTVTRLKEC